MARQGPRLQSCKEGPKALEKVDFRAQDWTAFCINPLFPCGFCSDLCARLGLGGCSQERGCWWEPSDKPFLLDGLYTQTFLGASGGLGLLDTLSVQTLTSSAESWQPGSFWSSTAPRNSLGWLPWPPRPQPRVGASKTCPGDERKVAQEALKLQSKGKFRSYSTQGSSRMREFWLCYLSWCLETWCRLETWSLSRRMKTEEGVAQLRPFKSIIHPPIYLLNSDYWVPICARHCAKCLVYSNEQNRRKSLPSWHRSILMLAGQQYF